LRYQNEGGFMLHKINENYHLSGFLDSDKPSLIEHLKVKQIYDQTLAIPFTYTEADADWWINFNMSQVKSNNGVVTNFGIRNSSTGELIGGIGFMDLCWKEYYEIIIKKMERFLMVNFMPELDDINS
jgi:RimJ/RimL family protein N-acetyltransferase